MRPAALFMSFALIAFPALAAGDGGVPLCSDDGWLLFGNVVVVLFASAALVSVCVYVLRSLFSRPVLFLVMFSVSSIVATIVADKTNGVNNLPPMPLRECKVESVKCKMECAVMTSTTLHSQLSTLRSSDVARGWRVECVTTNETVSYTMPSNAVYVSNWHVHGTRSSFGNNVIDFGSAGTPRPTSWSFPLGTNDAAFSSFWYFVDGRIRPTPKDAAREICAVGVPMSAVPGQSRLWSVVDDDSRVLTWENFFFGGDTNAPVNAQIRLFANGDFTTRSNGVETVCRRVNPDDWDGDGLANEKDENPLAYDGDFFGAANAMPTNANLDAYYQLDVAAAGALDFATIRITCDGPSDLGDHVIIARTNQVCHVPLLAGATYAVESDLPIAYSAVSSEYAHIITNSVTNLTVSLPLEFSVERIQTRDGGGASNYAVRSSPINVCPDVSAVTGGCCTVTGGEACFSWSCSEDCRCSGGDHSLWVSATWGGYRLAFPATAGCPCSHVAEQDENGASVRVSFTNEVVVFENAYTNAPGDVVSRRSTSTMLSCRADGGRFGGTVAVTLSDGGKLLRTQGTELPGSALVPAGDAVLLSAEYEALSESLTNDDIVATAVFTENMTGRQLTNETTLTAVKVELEADVTISEEARNRHFFGVAETVACRMAPNGVSGLSFNATKGTYSSASEKWTCPVVTNQVSGGLSVTRNSETIYDFATTTTPPTGIVAEHGVGYDFSVPPGTAGGAGMQLELHVLPKTVSFSNLSLAEVPTTTEGPTGYFTNVEFSAVWYHTPEMSAGEWRQMKGESLWIDDEAMMGDAFPSRQILEWAVGTIIWDIPIAWEVWDVVDKTYDKRISVLYKQRFDFSANGTLRVTKHGYWEERDPDDTKRASEGISTWTEPIIEPPQ